MAMASVRQPFSDAALDDLLRALHARTSTHPDNPGLIASWPKIPEEHMAAACAELRRRGHPVYSVSIAGPPRGRDRVGWSVRSESVEAVWPG